MNYQYSYETDISSMEELEAVLPLIAGVYGVILLFAAAIGITFYVLQSLSLYSIAKRRGLNKPWLAWIPVGSEWMIGSISDQYRYVTKNEVRSRRKLLMILSLVSVVLSCMVTGSAVSMLVNIFSSIDVLDYMSETEVISMILGPTLSVMGFSSILMIIAIVQMVFRYICMYDLFKSCDPANGVGYLVGSIVGAVLLGNILEPIFLMVVRKKDLGMPPRRDTYSPKPTLEQQTGYQEPWEQQ